MEKQMTRMEFDERMNAINVEQRKAAQPFNDRLQSIVAEKANINKKVAELRAESKRLGSEYEMYHQQCRKTNDMYEERKLELRQRFNATFTPKTKHPVDAQMMHHVRRCVLGCLKNALEGKCNVDDIRFDFHFEEDGSLTLDCEIPEIKEQV